MRYGTEFVQRDILIQLIGGNPVQNKARNTPGATPRITVRSAVP